LGAGFLLESHIERVDQLVEVIDRSRRPDRQPSKSTLNSGMIGGRVQAVLGGCLRNKCFACRPKPDALWQCG